MNHPCSCPPGPGGQKKGRWGWFVGPRGASPSCGTSELGAVPPRGPLGVPILATRWGAGWVLGWDLECAALAQLWVDGMAHQAAVLVHSRRHRRPSVIVASAGHHTAGRCSWACCAEKKLEAQHIQGSRWAGCEHVGLCQLQGRQSIWSSLRNNK